MQKIISFAAAWLSLMFTGCLCGASHIASETGDVRVVDASVEARTSADAAVEENDSAAWESCGELGTHFVEAVALSPDARWIAYASSATVTILDSMNGQVVRVLSASPYPSSGAMALAFTAEGDRLYLGTIIGVHEFALADGQLLRTTRLLRGCCGTSHVAVAANAGIALAYSEGMRVANLRDGTIRDLPITVYSTSDFDISPDGTLGVFASREGASLIRLADAAVVRTLPFSCSGFSFSPDGNYIACSHIGTPSSDDLQVASDPIASFTRTDGSSEIYTLRGTMQATTKPTWAPNGQRLYIGGRHEILEAAAGESSIRLDLTALARIPTHTAPRVLAADNQGHVYGGANHIWSVLRIPRRDETGWMRAGALSATEYPLAFDAEGRVLADGVIWNVDSGLAERIVDPFARLAALSKDGSLLAHVEGAHLHIDRGGHQEQRLVLPFVPTAIAIDGDLVVLASMARLAVIRWTTAETTAAIDLPLRSVPRMVEISPDARSALVDARVFDLSSGADVTPTAMRTAYFRNTWSLATYVDDGRLAFASDPFSVYARDGSFALTAAPGLSVRNVARLGHSLIAATWQGIERFDADTLTHTLLQPGTGNFFEGSLASNPEHTKIAAQGNRHINLYCRQ